MQHEDDPYSAQPGLCKMISDKGAWIVIGPGGISDYDNINGVFHDLFLGFKTTNDQTYYRGLKTTLEGKEIWEVENAALIRSTVEAIAHDTLTQSWRNDYEYKLGKPSDCDLYIYHHGQYNETSPIMIMYDRQIPRSY